MAGRLEKFHKDGEAKKYEGYYFPHPDWDGGLCRVSFQNSVLSECDDQLIYCGEEFEDIISFAGFRFIEEVEFEFEDDKEPINPSRYEFLVITEKESVAIFDTDDGVLKDFAPTIDAFLENLSPEYVVES